MQHLQQISSVTCSVSATSFEVECTLYHSDVYCLLFEVKALMCESLASYAKGIRTGSYCMGFEFLTSVLHLCP